MIIRLEPHRKIWRRDLEEAIWDCYESLQARRARGEAIKGVSKDADGDWAVWPEAIEQELKKLPRFRFASEREIWDAIERLMKRGVVSNARVE